MHEAAHAVIAWLLGYRVLWLRLYDEREKRRGRMELFKRNPPRQRRLIEAAEAIILTSGRRR